VSSGSSSHDLMRHEEGSLAFPRDLGEAVCEGRKMACTLDSRDEDGEIGGDETPTRCVSLLMSEKGALASSIRRCFRGGVLQYGGGGGRVGGDGVASTGAPTSIAAAVRGLLRDGITKRITSLVLCKCGRVWCACGRAMRTMDAQWPFFNVKCGRRGARD
jgi:hypothetical protein